VFEQAYKVEESDNELQKPHDDYPIARPQGLDQSSGKQFARSTVAALSQDELMEQMTLCPRGTLCTSTRCDNN